MRYLAVAALALLLAGSASSQGRFGIKAGVVLNYLNAEGSGAAFSDLKTGFTFGFSYIMPASTNFQVQPEFNFTYLKSDEAMTNSTVKFNYVQIPVLLKGVTTNQKLAVYAGPQLSFLTSSEASGGSGPNDITKFATRTLFDGVFGLEYTLPMNITLNARYVQTFSNVFKAEYDGFKSRHQYFAFLIGYRFGQKKTQTQ
ncbi:MAG TPA: porin family protein [Chitinophagaceae bacterium]